MSAKVQFELPDPTYEEYTWLYEDEHGPASQTPLIATSPTLAGGPAGESRAPPRAIRVNGYTYIRSEAAHPFGEVTAPDSAASLTQWRHEWLPQVEVLAKRLTELEPGSVNSGKWATTLAELEADFQRVFAGVHRTAVIAARIAVERFVDAYIDRFGEDRRADALALLQGFPNRSLDRAIMLWDISRLLRADSGLFEAVGQSDDLPIDSPAAQKFRDGLVSVMEAFGHTTNIGQQDLPTWREDPSIPMGLIKAYAAQEDDLSPQDAADRQVQQRVRLEGELKARAASDPAAAALIPLMEMAQQFLPNLEDHNLLVDQRLFSASRARWLSIGTHLVERGKLASADDVFYYTRGELLEVLEGEDPLSRKEVASRRTAQVEYRAATPPRVLGTSRQAEGQTSAGQTSAGEAIMLHGTSASPGSYRGLARVVKSLNEAPHLADGEVLVCPIITSPWTPYLCLAGAIVTDAGGALSHGAIVAREFGIPAVVGTKDATARIPNGAPVTVDGTTGVVTVEAS